MDWDGLVEQWKSVLEAIVRLGGDSSDLVIDRPATEDEVSEVESELGMALPASLREVFLARSGRVNFSWSFPGHFDRPAAIRNACFGELELSLDGVVQAESDRRRWISDVLSTRGDPVLERGWDGVIAIQDTGSGDFVAIDLRQAGRQPVVTLSHDEDRIMDAVLGRDCQDFLDRWSSIGCVGPDAYLFEIFLETSTGPIHPNGENARLWRKTIGLGG